MTLEESIYLDNLKNYAFTEIGDKSTIFIVDSCSYNFYKSVSRFLGQKSNIKYGSKKELKNKKYNLIIDRHDKPVDTAYLAYYEKNLLLNGIISIASHNHTFLQNNKLRNISFNNKTDKLLAKHHLFPIFREPLGKFYLINRLDNSKPINKILSKIGKIFPNSKLYSPYFIFIYQHSNNIKKFNKPYRPATSMKKRLYRLHHRGVVVTLFYKPIINFINNIFFSYKYNISFKTNVIPKIPTHQEAKDKKTIVIAMTYLGMGGVERVMLNIIKGINRDRFIIHLITTTSNNNVWHNKFKEYTDYITHIPKIINEDWPSIYVQRYIEEYISKNKADILLITNSSPTYHATRMIKKIIPNIRIYDILHTHGTPRDRDAYLRISMPFDKYITKRIVIDRYLKDYYVNKYHVNKNKVSIIYNGIDNEGLVNMKDGQKDAFFEKIPMGKKIVTYIGRLDEDKSPVRLVDIAMELKKRNIPTAIVVVGDGSLSDTMIEKSENAGILDSYIYFYGSSHNPLPLAKLSDFTILVSNSEGIPMSILESMSVTTPAIAPAVGGIPEIIDHMIDGLLVPIDRMENEKLKIQAFTDAIIKACSLSDKDYQKMQSSANKKIMKRFSNMPKIYEHLFETGVVLNEKTFKNKG